MVAALERAGRRVVALDARGHGESDKPHDPARYGEDRMARDLVALLDELDLGEVDLAGYSMGAIVSLIAATREPRIRRLVVGGIGYAAVEIGGVDTRALPKDVLVAALRATDPETIDHPVAARFRAVADQFGADREALAAQASAANTTKIPLDEITAPTLVIAGDEDDRAVRPEVLAEAIPGARLLVVPGTHLSAPLDPGFAPAIVEFLDSR